MTDKKNKTINVKMNPDRGKRLIISGEDIEYSFSRDTIIEIPISLYEANKAKLLKAKLKKPATANVKKPINDKPLLKTEVIKNDEQHKK